MESEMSSWIILCDSGFRDSLTSLLDIDQWNKVTELLGTPSESFLNQLQPSVREDKSSCAVFF